MSTGRRTRLVVVASAWLVLVGIYAVNLSLGREIWPSVQAELGLILKVIAVVFLPVTGYALWPKYYQRDYLDSDPESSETDSKR